MEMARIIFPVTLPGYAQNFPGYYNLFVGYLELSIQRTKKRGMAMVIHGDSTLNATLACNLLINHYHDIAESAETGSRLPPPRPSRGPSTLWEGGIAIQFGLRGLGGSPKLSKKGREQANPPPVPGHYPLEF